MRKYATICVFLVLFAFCTKAQSIGPSVINSTGGTFKIPSSNFVLDWNVGEMTLVNTSTSTSSIYVITNGFLQPTKYGHIKDDKKDDKKDDVLTKTLNPVTLKEDVVDMIAFPNPVVNFVDVKVLVTDAHSIKYSLFNQVGERLLTREKSVSKFQQPERISLAGFTSGTYLLNVECLSADGKTIRTGSFKIVKAN